MTTPNFIFSATPRIIFGPGRFAELPGLVLGFGTCALLITGSASFRQSAGWRWLQGELDENHVSWRDASIASEPDPLLIDHIVEENGSEQVDVVVAIGGGSVIDTGKAVSAMLPLREPVSDYLEGIGRKKHPGVKIPFIAVPTTSGTGTEATKNASLRRLGDQGFKKSLRHENFVPDVALVDPELALTCPANLTATCGMDALAQLLESYVSPKASPLTDALALSGLHAVRNGLLKAYVNGAHDLGARSDMAYAAMISGITLANAGLGIVHSLSSLIGGYFDIPHGVICGRLLPAGMRANIECMSMRIPEFQSQLRKHAHAGALLAGKDICNGADASEDLVRILEDWVERLKIPRLSEYGLGPADYDRILAKASNRDNPVQLNLQEIRSILEQSI